MASRLLGPRQALERISKVPCDLERVNLAGASVWCLLGLKPKYLTLPTLGFINLILRTHRNFRAFKI